MHGIYVHARFDDLDLDAISVELSRQLSKQPALNGPQRLAIFYMIVTLKMFIGLDQLVFRIAHVLICHGHLKN